MILVFLLFQPQSIQGDLGSWFGYDFDFDEVDDNVRLFVGAPRQQAVYYSDYDVNEWKNARQLPQQLLYHEQHITTRFVGAVVRCQALIDPLVVDVHTVVTYSSAHNN